MEKPFLKPIMIAGPTCTEKTELIQALIKEFPDVFALARLTTTQKDDEWDYRVADDFDMRAHLANKARSQIGSNVGSKRGLNRIGSGAGSQVQSFRAQKDPGKKKAAAALPTMPEVHEGDDDSEGGGRQGTPDILDIPYELEARRNIVSDEEFDAMIKRSEFLEHHKDLFKHEMVRQRPCTYSMRPPRDPGWCCDMGEAGAKVYG